MSHYIILNFAVLQVGTYWKEDINLGEQTKTNEQKLDTASNAATDPMSNGMTSALGLDSMPYNVRSVQNPNGWFVWAIDGEGKAIALTYIPKS